MEHIAVVLSCVGVNRELPLVVECFLRQTYARRHLHVVNVLGSIVFDHPLVTIHNLDPQRYPTVRHQIAFGIEAAGCRYFAKWDADDFYAPWFLEDSMRAMAAHPGFHVKPADGWWVQGWPYRSLSVAGNRMEGSWLLDRHIIPQLLDLDYNLEYLDAHFFMGGMLQEYPVGPVKNYGYTWDNGSEHLSYHYKTRRDLFSACRAYREFAARHHGVGPVGSVNWSAEIGHLASRMEPAVREAFLQRVQEASTFATAA